MTMLRAVKSFLGAPGESLHPDGMIRRGQRFSAANEDRARALLRHGLVVRDDAKEAPAPSNKMKAAAQNKETHIPLEVAAAESGRGRRAKGQQSQGSEPTGSRTGDMPSQSSSAPVPPPPPSETGSKAIDGGDTEISAS